MRFVPTTLPPVTVVELEPIEDERGSFARTWCADEFAAAGLNPQVAQSSISTNLARGTLRGLHFQAAPDDETKLVRCTHGAIFDVAVDLRPDSPTYLHWFGLELTGTKASSSTSRRGSRTGSRRSPTTPSSPMPSPCRMCRGRARRPYDDPAIGVEWPLPNPIVSDRDRGLPTIAG